MVRGVKAAVLFYWEQLLITFEDPKPAMLEQTAGKNNSNIINTNEEAHRRKLIKAYTKFILAGVALLQIYQIFLFLVGEENNRLQYTFGNIALAVSMIVCLKLANGYSKLAGLVLITCAVLIWGVVSLPSRSAETTMLGFAAIALIALAVSSILVSIVVSIFGAVYSAISLAIIPISVKATTESNFVLGLILYSILILMLLFPIRERYNILYKAIQQQQRLYQRAVQVREQEQQNFWDILHSQVIYTLVQVRYISNETDLQSENAELRALITATEKVAREVLQNLSPDILDVGLDYALDKLIKDITATGTSKLRTSCNYVVQKRLDDTLNRAIYKIVREALRNIVLHSSATTASVDLWENSGKVSLQIRDNGIGFSVPENILDLPKNHGGLLSIYERCAALGASLYISSQPGHTVINITFNSNTHHADRFDGVSKLASVSSKLIS
jgi:signal transduction histidine kinase